MCIAPNVLADGTITACHKCWQCIEQAVYDWVGRNIAENKTSVQSHAVTLTYGRDDGGRADHVRAAILTYSDVKNMLKKLRNHGYPVRYFITGEFGTKKGRTHWHGIFHWQDKVPEHELGKNCHIPHWEHGHTMWKQPTPEAIAYNCKYILKDYADGARQTSLPRMSKKPPLGHRYFMSLAERMVKEGVSPQDLNYQFRGVTRRKKDGTRELTPFRLRDRSADNFLTHYVLTWERLRPGEIIPPSEVIYNWLTPELKEERGIIARHRDSPVGNAVTVAQRLQRQKDADRLKQLREGRERDEMWGKTEQEKPVREMNPIIRRGPQTLHEVQAEIAERERFESLGKEQQQFEQQQREDQRRKLREQIVDVVAESLSRQGRVKVTDDEGKDLWVNPADAERTADGNGWKVRTKNVRRSRKDGDDQGEGQNEFIGLRESKALVQRHFIRKSKP